MTTDVPLSTDIQNACQPRADESRRKINEFYATSNVPNDAPRSALADFLATPMISCAAQHQRLRGQSPSMRHRALIAHRTRKHQRARLGGGACCKPRQVRPPGSVRDLAATSCDCKAKRRDRFDGTQIADLNA
ncbi:hypothetical protein [Bradyrhizobium embrapense]